MKVSQWHWCSGLVLALSIFGPAIAGAQGPWKVTVTPTVNPLPVGTCGPVWLKVFDPKNKDTPRSPNGSLLSIADFDLTVATADGKSAVGQYTDAFHWSVCACQGAAIGSVGTITASYPGQSLSNRTRVPGVTSQTTVTITLAAAKSEWNPPGCPTPTPTTIATAVPVQPAAVLAVPVQPVTTQPTAAPVGTQLIAPAPVTTKTAVAPAPVGVLPGPAPTGVTVTATPASATLEWQAVPGVASYVVTRQQANVPAVAQTLAASNTGMYDSGLQPATTYNWTIRAIQADGREGSTSVTFATLPAPAPAPAPAPVPAPAPAPAAAPGLSATARLTPFKPATHGFQFTNDFKNNFIPPPVSMITSGLCGGMSYAVLDWYYAGRAIPNQSYRPANATPLMMYLYGRQVTSLESNIDKWIETTVNPFGSRTTEFFNWGINERLVELKSFIDRGVPVPLGLKGTDGGISHDHQVVAIGYDAGRYQGDLGAYKEDLKIYIFDPNYPTETVTLVPSPTTSEYYYLEHTNNRWRTYFVDGKYAAMAPPNIVSASYPADGLVHELQLAFLTGVDDMRGGADHVDLTITLADNTTQSYPNISLSGRWLPDYIETASVVLRQPVSQATLRTFTLSTNATGGLLGDSWEMTWMRAYAVGGGFSNSLLSVQAGPYRFTGAGTPLVIQVK